MRIAVDVDGVLRDFVGSLVRVYKKHNPDHTILPREQWNWKLVNNFPDFEGTNNDLYRWIFRGSTAEDIMRNAEMFDNASVAFNELQEHSKGRHKLVIVSNQHPGIEHHTSYWLGKHGFLAKEIWYVENKLEAKCDVLIDDKPKNLQDYKNAGKISLSIERPWNTDWKEGKTFKSFEESAKWLKSI